MNRESQLKAAHSTSGSTDGFSTKSSSPEGGQYRKVMPQVMLQTRRGEESSPALSGGKLVDILKRPSLRLDRRTTYGQSPRMQAERHVPGPDSENTARVDESLQQPSPNGSPAWLQIAWTDLIGAILLTVLLVSAVSVFQ